jgi:hypothetical protein
MTYTDNFLNQHSDQISPQERAAIREAAVKFIQSGETKFPDDFPGAEFREEIRRAVLQDAYQYRVAGQTFNTKQNPYPEQGYSRPGNGFINPVRL